MNLDSAVLYSNNINTAAAFYRDVIGLELEYQQGEKYVSFMFENGVRLGIKKAVEEREIPGAQTIFIGVDNAAATYEKYQKLGVDFHKQLATQSWGIEFAIYDPDRNKVEFLERS